MLQLAYISSSRPGLTLADVEDILTGSRRRNEADRVTGLLIFDGRRFLQVLEGNAETVERTYGRIVTDPRHRAIVKLSSRDVAERAFGPWAMASHIVSPVVGIGDLAAKVDAMTTGIADANMREMLRGFARVRHAA